MISLTVINTEPGKIEGCTECSRECHYGCCHQLKAHDPSFGPQNSIMLYPGEWESVRGDTRRHLLITLDDYNGGKLAYCDRENFDQSACNPTNNFKPLDCESYPFAPAFEGNELCLHVDRQKCPLSVDQLRAHYVTILAKWREVIGTNPAVEKWVRSLDLADYVRYEPALEERHG